MKKYNFSGETFSSTFDYDDWDTLTRLYNKVPVSIKDDFYENKFDSDLSLFYVKNNEVIGGVLSKEKNNEDDPTQHCICDIYGVLIPNDEYLPFLLKDYINHVRGIRKKKTPHRFKGKYGSITVQTDNPLYQDILKKLGFVVTYENRYMLQIR